MQGVSLPFLRPREEFSSLKSRRGGKGGSKEREGGTEREVQRRETASQSREAEVMDSAHRKVTVFS